MLIKTIEDTLKIQAKIYEIVEEIKKGKSFDFEITEHKEKRSLNANAYFHLLVHKIAEIMKIGNDECKVKMNLEYGTPKKIDENTLFAFKVPKGAKVNDIIEYPKLIKTVIDNGKELDIYIVYKETHTLNKSEMARLIDGVVQECQNLNIETKTPNEIKDMINLWEQEK